MKKILPAVPLTLALTLASSSASGAEPFTKEKTVLSAELAYGLWLGDELPSGLDLNYYGFGLGLRGGYTLPQNIYLGGRFIYFLGQGGSVDVSGEDTDTRANTWEVLVEAGYDLGLSKDLVVRPKLGLGPMQGRVKTCRTPGPLTEFCETGSQTAVAVSLGAELPIRFDSFVLSPEMRFNIWTGEGSASGLVLGVHAGMHF